MKPAFADTSFYVAVLNARDVAHAKALDVSERFVGQVLLTDFILLELGNALSSVGQRGLFSRLFAHLRSDPNVQIIPASRDFLMHRSASFQYWVRVVPELAK